MEVVKTVFPTDPDILLDVRNSRQNDSHKILRRLDSLHRHSESNRLTSLGEYDTKCLLDLLVESYLRCSDSIKVSRAIETLWQPLLPMYRGHIETCFGIHIMNVTREKLEDLQNVSRFSVLLEQNDTVRVMVERNLSDVVCWISEELPPLLQQSPSSLSVSQCQFIYAFIKIILQLFQLGQEKLGTAIWRDSESEIKPTDTFLNAVKVIQTSLLRILCVKGYQMDCVLLCGTATASMLNSSPKPQSAQTAFYNILQSTLSTDFMADSNEDMLTTRCTPTSIDLERLSNLAENDTGAVALIRGAVACGSNDILFSKFVDKLDNTHPPMFVTLFTYIIQLCQGNITLHYHSFQVMLLWYSRITKSVDWTEDNEVVNQMRFVIQQTLDIVMLNWDSPVEDVPETVVNIFDHMMSFWSMVNVQMPDLPQSVLQTLLSTAWFVKGKYRVFAVILKFLDHRKVLEEYPDIKSQLLECLTTNHLSSTATNVYKAFLTQLKKHANQDVNETWQSLWMDTVIQGLLSDNSLLRYNASSYWIPVSLKLIPGCGVMLKDHLTILMEKEASTICYTRLLHAWTVINKTDRMTNGKVDLSNVHVREALHCLDEAVRSEAISMICTTLKKTEPISVTEISLLQEVLIYNIKIDSAPFRQHLASSLRNLLTRLRDSCITSLKSPDKNAEVLGRCIEFVDWLHRLCMDYLLPGSSFQRRKGCLDILKVLYECLIYRPDDKQRKGFTPDSAVRLVKHATENHKWDFFSIENIHVLVLCILDGASEIQTGAFNLLTRYYDFPCTDENDTLDSMCCHLLRESLRLCNSPKGHEDDSGSILCKLIFQKYILSQSLGYTFIYNEDLGDYRVVSNRSEKRDKLDFIQSLLDEAKRQMNLANENLVKASKLYPIHGLIVAITRCVTETPDLLQSVGETGLLNILSELIEFCDEVIHKMLKIMASVAGQEASPSFAEIGVALETLIQENQADYTESTSQSPEFQYMLAWCWNNINDCCSCLSDVTSTVVLNKLPLTHTVVEKISSTYISVLTKCRHKGVIEGCRTAFVKFCTAVSSSDQEQYYKIPANVLSKVLTSLKNNIMSSSVTRRSAGLPIIVQAVLVSERKIKQTVLLQSSVLALFETAQLPLEVDSGQTDLPQVHGLNILNSLFSDASLSGSLTGHISQAVVMVIKEFGSPSWLVRNAATRFFSTLIKRIFGQKKTSDTTLCNTVTFQELSSYYPELPPFLLTVLKEASERDIHDIRQIHPGLFPALTLLSSLNPVNTESKTVIRELKLFKEKMQPFLASPVYQLRHLVASALVAMVNMADMKGHVEVMLDQCLSVQTCNQLHGNLLFILQLIHHVTRPEDWKRLLSLVMNLQHIIDCVPIVSSGYIKLLTSLVEKQPDFSLPDDLLMKIEAYCCSDDKDAIGVGIFMNQSVQLLFQCNQSTESQLFRLVQKVLSSSNQDTRKACLEYLGSKISGLSQQVHSWNHEIVKTLCSSLKMETNIPNLCKVLQLITSLFLNNTPLELESINELQDWFQNNWPLTNQYVSLKAAALPVWGIVIQHDVTHKEQLENVDAIIDWCDDLLKNTRVTNETQRLAVTQALLIAGRPILNLVSVKQLRNLSTASVSLLSCCLILVQDEDTEIRQEACKFLSHLKFKTDISLFKYNSLHSNICYELLLEYAVQQFCFSTRCIEFLIAQLYTQGQLVKVMEEKETTRFHQLFDQEDNSFYAEKIFNAFCIHRCLKTAMARTLDVDAFQTCIEACRQDVSRDMDTLMDILRTSVKDCMINVCSDSTVLASMCSVMLMCDLINHTKLKDQLSAVLQMDRLPLNMQKQFISMMAT